MRVGEILLERGWLDWEMLAQALREQRGSGLRMCSLLIARGYIQFDEAAQVLGQQLGTAAVLKKHLARRDRRLAKLLDPDVARANTALPVGRMGDGALIVAVRDPSPKMQAALTRVLRGPIVLAVTPAGFIERLVEQTYPRDVHVPIDVELGPDASDFDIEVDDSESDFDIPIDVELSEPATPRRRALPVTIRPLTEPGATTRDSLDATIAAFADIDQLEWLFDVVTSYVTKRWQTSLILAIKDRRASGVRGHGRRLKPSAIQAFGVALAETPLVRLARDDRRMVDEAPDDGGHGHRELMSVLDHPARPAAAPIRAGDHVRFVIVVGDPTDGDPERAALDLEVLAEGASTVLERL